MPIDSRRWRSRVALLVLAVALPAAFLARGEDASADFSAGNWSHESSACNYSTTRLDPVSLIFYEWGYADRSANSVNYHFGWSNAGGSTQWFASHGNCEAHSHDPASAGNPRYHVRMKKTTDGDSFWGVTTQSTPHYERNVDCSFWPFVDRHAVYGPPSVSWSGFVEGRERIINGLYFREGHGFYGYQWKGNTEPRITQCNGDNPRNDGYFGFIRQHYSFH